MESILSSLLLVLSVAIANAITVQDLYPHHPKHCMKLKHGDVVSSTKIYLAVPAMFYDKEYDSLWVHTDGFIAFAPDTSDVQQGDFPYNQALLAPFMTDLDTSNRGEIFYKEHHDEKVLTRATNDVRRAFSDAEEFQAESAFVVTWKEVEGRSLNGEVATFTFQSILVSNGKSTYAIFLYPESKMGATLSESDETPLFRARAGFNQGPGKYLEMFPVDSLVDYRNTDRNGEWIFQVGGENVRQNNDVISPQIANHRKRQVGTLINVQEVALSSDDDEDEGDIVTRVRPSENFCSRPDLCIAPHSSCASYSAGYCCECEDGYVGNGSFCLQSGIPFRANGNITGVVDVLSSDGSVKRVKVNNANFHAFATGGRVFAAANGVEPDLAYAIQPLSVIGDVVGWLIASAQAPALNGFQLTGGKFQRRVSVTFKQGGYRFDLRQKFNGVTSITNNIPFIEAKTDFVGVLPAIPNNTVVTMDNLREIYTRRGPGHISSTSRRTYKVNETAYTYDVTQTIIFRECAAKPALTEMEVTSSNIYLNYNPKDLNVRHATNMEIRPVGDVETVVNPCDDGSHNCGERATCYPQAGANYQCRCDAGYEWNGRTCEPTDPCARVRCGANSVCVAISASDAECQCYDGFQKNQNEQCEEIRADPVNPCDDGRHRCGSNSICRAEEGTNYYCDCLPGFRKNSADECIVSRPDESTDPCRRNVCGQGRCVSIGSTYSCNCQPGYYFNGRTCEDTDECAENRHNCDAEAICTNSAGSFQCVCNPGYQGDGFTCTKEAKEKTECQRQYEEVDELIRSQPQLQDGPIYPTCMEDGSFAPRQCNDFTEVCWCVETQYGVPIEGTETEPGLGNLLDCSNPSAPIVSTPAPTPPPGLTQCQMDRWEVNQAKLRQPNRGPVYEPLCTLAGAYEPIQYHPANYYLCVDFNGVEVSRHATQPTCLTDCQRSAYYADTENIFVGTNNFVPQCDDAGAYAKVQCDINSKVCYCVDENGREIELTRVKTENPELVPSRNLNCERFLQPSQDEIPSLLVFAQAMGINEVSLPIDASSKPKRLYSRHGQTVVGVAFDCSTQTVYWTDVSGRSIYMAPLHNIDSKQLFAKKVRSPEGIAVDPVSKNVFWTDSGLHRIEVAQSDGKNRMVLVTAGLVDPRGIAVDPVGAKIYWTDWERNNPRIMQANMDGTQQRIFYRDGVTLPNDVTIDQRRRKLCFLDAGPRNQSVICMNLDGSGVRVKVQISPSRFRQKPFGLAVNGDMVYYTDRLGRLYAVDSSTGDKVSIEGPVGAHGQMFGIAIGYNRCGTEENACSRENGGCSHLCLPLSRGRVCKCPPKAVNCREQ